MNEVSYFKIRGQHYSQLVLETVDVQLKSAYAAIAADMAAKLATADPNRQVLIIDGVAVGESSAVRPRSSYARRYARSIWDKQSRRA